MKKVTTVKNVLKYYPFLFRISTLISMIHFALLINVIKNWPIIFFFLEKHSRAPTKEISVLNLQKFN